MLANEIEIFLNSLFSKLNFFFWNFSTNQPKGFDTQNENHKNYSVDVNQEIVEFQNCITLWRMPEENSNQLSLFIGKKLSDKFGIRVLIPYTIPGKEFDPYWNIVFKNNKSFLVEDFDTNFGESSNKKLLKIQNEYLLNIKKFNQNALIATDVDKN